MTIEPGTKVQAASATGKLLARRAVTNVVRGDDFPVVWITREEEWQAAEAEGREPDAVPWPAEDVTPADEGDDDDVNEVAHRVVREATDGE